jgi:2-polyprenyl-3-methyl-5-hydroxy-6-metoxy-1,4-benzoquinol methylase
MTSFAAPSQQDRPGGLDWKNIMSNHDKNANATLSKTTNKAGFEKAYWENVWKSVPLPRDRELAKYHELHELFHQYLPQGNHNLLEVGCAPGSWLSYFAKNFGYTVSGIEYAEDAFKKTVENLGLLSVSAQIHLSDFFTFTGYLYDIVFSYGFIEHFENVEERVIEHLVSLCSPGGYVVTIIPGLEGLNWWISKTFRPKVALGHYPITRKVFRLMHEKQKLQTLWTGSYGCFQFRPPFNNTQLARRRPRLSKALNTPFKTWNRAVSMLTRQLGLYPRVGPLFLGTVYIGRKPDTAFINQPNQTNSGCR